MDGHAAQRPPVRRVLRRRAAPVPQDRASSGGPDRAWGVVLGAFLVTMAGYGAIYSYAGFADAIAAEFGASRSALTLVYGLSGGACFFVSALSGPLADRLGPRVLAAAGMGLVATGFLVAAAAETLLAVYLGYGVLTGLGTGCAYVPALAAVQRGFVAHRGLASGLALSGIGLGTALVPLATEAAEALGGWRPGFVACAAAVLALGVPGALLLGPAPPRAAGPAPGLPLCAPGFALAYLGTMLATVPAVLPHALLVSSAVDRGLGAREAVGLLGLVGLGTIIGRFVLAAAADLLGRRLAFLLCCAAMALSLLAWALAPGLAALQAFALGFGALQGGFVALLPAFVADSFGPRGLGGVLGLLYTARGVALLGAPAAVALAGTALGGHAAPVAGAAALGLAGTALLARLPARAG